MNSNLEIYVFGLGSENGVRKILPVFGTDVSSARAEYVKILCSIDTNFAISDFDIQLNHINYCKHESVDRVDGYELAK